MNLSTWKFPKSSFSCHMMERIMNFSFHKKLDTLTYSPSSLESIHLINDFILWVEAHEKCRFHSLLMRCVLEDFNMIFSLLVSLQISFSLHVSFYLLCFNLFYLNKICLKKCFLKYKIKDLNLQLNFYFDKFYLLQHSRIFFK